jgi:hypothetical protein
MIKSLTEKSVYAPFATSLRPRFGESIPSEWHTTPFVSFLDPEHPANPKSVSLAALTSLELDHYLL